MRQSAVCAELARLNADRDHSALPRIARLHAVYGIRDEANDAARDGVAGIAGWLRLQVILAVVNHHRAADNSESAGQLQLVVFGALFGGAIGVCRNVAEIAQVMRRRRVARRTVRIVLRREMCAGRGTVRRRTVAEFMDVQTVRPRLDTGQSHVNAHGVLIPTEIDRAAGGVALSRLEVRASPARSFAEWLSRSRLRIRALLAWCGRWRINIGWSLLAT